MNQARLQHKKEMVAGKFIIGIDPAKNFHQAAVIDANGTQLGKSFSFPVTNEGYTALLWRNIDKCLGPCNSDTVVFAVETSCNLWQTIVYFLHGRGFAVAMVSPLSTYHQRPILDHDFSRTDPKDAFHIATLAQRGSFDLYEQFSPHSNAMHSLGIAYDKLRKNLAQNRARLRALLERLFPEFLTVLEPDTDSAMYLLKRYLFPDEFLAMDIEKEAASLETISRHQHGRETLLRLVSLAKESIGIVKRAEERLAERLVLNSWMALIDSLKEQMKLVMGELVHLAGDLPSFDRLTSLSGVGEKLAALFLAEVRDLSRFPQFKTLEKYAGLNLRLSQSGQYTGARHISHIGNKRLLWILYRMTEETAKRVPEVRMKYLARQLKRRKHRKSIVASTPQLLQLIVALEREQRMYEPRKESLTKLSTLEEQYRNLSTPRRRTSTTPQAASTHRSLTAPRNRPGALTKTSEPVLPSTASALLP